MKKLLSLFLLLPLIVMAQPAPVVRLTSTNGTVTLTPASGQGVVDIETFGGVTNALTVDVTNITTNANGQLTVGPNVVTNNNFGNVTFQHALTTGSGTGVDVFTVKGKIYQPYGGPSANGNVFNNGAWSDDGNGMISSAGLNTGTFTSQTIQNSGNFNSDAGSFYSDGSGNVIINTLTSEGAILTDSLSSGPSTFSTISSDIGAIHSDGAGTLYASKFNGDGGLETNIVWSRSIWNFNPTPQLSPYYIVMGLTAGAQTSATRAIYPTVESEIIPKAGILSLMITIQNGTGAGGAGSNIYIFACSNGVVLSPPALTIPISSLTYLTPITYTATNYTTWAGGTNLLSLILSNNSTTSVAPFSVFGFSGAIQVR